MEVYFIVLAISLVLLYFSEKIKSKDYYIKVNNKITIRLNIKYIFFFISLLPLILMSGLRYNIGLDYPTYVSSFESLSEGKRIDRFEIGFYLLNKLVIFLNGNIAFLFILISVITLLPLIKVSKDNKIKLYLLVLCYVCLGFYCYSFNTVRQFISISICLMSYNFIIGKNWFKYIVMIWIATMFHSSSIIMLPLYFILNYRYSFMQYFFVYVIFFVVKILSNPIKNYIIRTFYPIYYDSFRMSYFNNDYSLNFIIISVFLVGLMLYIIKTNKGVDESDDEATINIFNVDKNIAFYCLVWSTTIGWLGEMGIRLSFFLRIFYIIIIARFLGNKSEKKFMILLKIIIVIFMILYFAYILYASIDTNNPFIPYEVLPGLLYSITGGDLL